MKRIKKHIKVSILLLAAAFLVPVLYAPALHADPNDGALRIEKDVSLVCMVTNRYMGSEMIPVDVDGKTYYGCCTGCTGKIQKNLNNVRNGTDPVTGKEVDKALALIAVDKTGKAFYFESEETFNEYSGGTE